MAMNSGRAPLDLDEEFTELRSPRKQLSISAEEFVPKSLKSKAATSPDVAADLVANFSPATVVVPPSIANSSSVQRRLQIQQASTQLCPIVPPIAVPAAAATMQQQAINQNGHTIPQPFCSSSVQNRLKIRNTISGGVGGGGGGGGDGDSSGGGGDSTYILQQQDHQSYPTAPSMEVEAIALDYLATVIKCLNENPGSFDNVATRFLTIFDGMENNNYVLSNAMEDIFNHSINNPNFRYMGAKLYNLLHMLNLRSDSLFHSLLKCKLDYHQKDVLEFIKCSPHKVRETALFLAELYMQLRGDDSRIHLIAENIVFSLKQLLTKECPDNVRCICLTLKLAGYDLDIDCSSDIKIIIEKLDTINNQNPGKYPLIGNIISLQRKNWGRKISSSLSQSLDSKHVVISNESNNVEPTLYGPDGEIITEEENYFLSENSRYSPNGSLNGYTSAVVDGSGGGGGGDDDDIIDSDIEYDPEMDEETEKAYRKFCKLSMTGGYPSTNT